MAYGQKMEKVLVLQVMLIEWMPFRLFFIMKGGVAPGDTSNTYKTQLVTYQTCQTYGWQSTVLMEQLAVLGQAKSLAGIKINLGDTGYSGGIQFERI